MRTYKDLIYLHQAKEVQQGIIKPPLSEYVDSMPLVGRTWRNGKERESCCNGESNNLNTTRCLWEHMKEEKKTTPYCKIGSCRQTLFRLEKRRYQERNPKSLDQDCILHLFLANQVLLHSHRHCNHRE